MQDQLPQTKEKVENGENNFKENLLKKNRIYMNQVLLVLWKVEFQMYAQE